jgi:hypothetical protein
VIKELLEAGDKGEFILCQSEHHRFFIHTGNPVTIQPSKLNRFNWSSAFDVTHKPALAVDDTQALDAYKLKPYYYLTMELLELPGLLSKL